MTSARQPLLTVRGLRVDYETRLGLFRRGSPTTVLQSLDLDVYPRETLGLVGESGSGKTTLLETLLRLRPATEGTIVLDGHDVSASRRERRRQWTRDVQVVFQNPFSSLDPRLRVADIVAEPLRAHPDAREEARKEIVAELLERVGLSRGHLRAYPHQLSGGQAQRVAIARSLVLQPRLVLLDEPTSALDVSVQAHVLNLLLELQESLGLTYLFVSHDLGVVQHISHRIAVMYLGQLVELSTTEALISSPKHPYAQALLAASALSTSPGGAVLKGAVPKFSDIPSGCRFHPRCPFVMDVCRTVEPAPHPIDSSGGFVRCHLYNDDELHKRVSLPTPGTNESVNQQDNAAEARAKREVVRSNFGAASESDIKADGQTDAGRGGVAEASHPTFTAVLSDEARIDRSYRGANEATTHGSDAR